MATQAQRVSVTTAATRLDVAIDSDGLSTLQSIALQNLGNATVYLGGANVTTAAGWPVVSGASFTMDLQPGSPLYGLVAAGSVEIAVLQSGV